MPEQLKQGAGSLVGNKGYRKFLRTDRDLSATDCALRYKDLWMVEQSFRHVKSVLETRPIYHKCDETIRGHVFCSFLALILLKELLERLKRCDWKVEWDRLREDLDALEEITVQTSGRSFVIRSAAQGDAGKAIQAVGVSLGSAVRLLDATPSSDARASQEEPCSANAPEC